MATALQEKKEVRIGDYVVTGKIGQGGIAEIFRARQESLNRDVAIKILFPKLTFDPEIVRRFERESLVVARLNHPNIVHIIDRGSAGGRYFFVMEYVDGTNLKEIIAADQVPLRTKLEMIVSICKALDYAHKNGVIHRDIKPANVLIDRQGNALVADFGIAQIVGTPESEATSTDVIMGTFAYMSPEQKVSSTNVDHTTDIYAVGVMLYELLIGKKPMGRFKLPSEINRQLDSRFDDIIMKCLSQDAKDRYQSAVKLKDAVLEIIGGTGVGDNGDDVSFDDSDSFLGKCRYLDTIRETKFGSTILVENKLNKRLYVIKKHNKGPAGRKEANLLKSLKHKNVINIFGAGGDKNSTVVISEYAPGGSLADRLVRRWDWEKAFGVMQQVAAGLDFVHKNNIVHGNLRPSNVLFDANEVVRLSDFGLPIHYDGPGKKNWYSPPERKASRQGDIYGLGVILHQMLTGRNPGYDSANNLHLDDMRGEIPHDVCDILGRLLAIRVAHRYQTAEEFMFDWSEAERRKRDKVQRQVFKANPGPAPKESPVWLYAAVGLGVVIMVLVVLFVSGALT
jgi:serine/threonine-protein kinase